jgi:hypothetical protein
VPAAEDTPTVVSSLVVTVASLVVGVTVAIVHQYNNVTAAVATPTVVSSLVAPVASLVVAATG